jgi:hypothetical protein
MKQVQESRRAPGKPCVWSTDSREPTVLQPYCKAGSFSKSQLERYKLTLAPLLSCTDVFLGRVEELRLFLLGRPEQTIAVVSHSGVLEALTGGYLFQNGEIKTFLGSELSGPEQLH